MTSTSSLSTASAWRQRGLNGFCAAGAAEMVRRKDERLRREVLVGAGVTDEAQLRSADRVLLSHAADEPDADAARSAILNHARDSDDDDAEDLVLAVEDARATPARVAEIVWAPMRDARPAFDSRSVLRRRPRFFGGDHSAPCPWQARGTRGAGGGSRAAAPAPGPRRAAHPATRPRPGAKPSRNPRGGAPAPRTRAGV